MIVKLPYPVLCGLAFIWCTSSNAAQINGQVDSQTLSLGDSLTYTLTADENLTEDALDIRPLFRDFIIGNLQVTHPSATETSWIIPLQPVTAGEVTIPALKIADSESQPLIITVDDNKQGMNSNSYIQPPSETEYQAPTHLIESQISTESAYRNEVITYTVKMAKRADPQNNPPVIPSVQGATITPLEDPTEDKEIFADHYQETLTYPYIVIPETTGSLKLTGSMLASDNKQISSEHIINIKPIPAAFLGSDKEWLPSSGITIEDRWEPQTSYVKTGQPLTRIITLTGINNTTGQLPDLALPEISDVRIYNDGQKDEQQLQNGMLISRKTFRQIFIPEKNITFAVPSLHLNWWNTISDRAQVASLEERKFLASVVATKTAKVAADPVPAKKAPSNAHYWTALLLKILTAIGVVIALVTPLLAVIWYYRKRLRNRYERYQLWKILKQACTGSDALAVYQALFVWASHRWDQQFTCAEQLPFYTQLRNELEGLHIACFGESEVNWNGRKLIQALGRISVIKTVSEPAKDGFDEFSY